MKDQGLGRNPPEKKKADIIIPGIGNPANAFGLGRIPSTPDANNWTMKQLMTLIDMGVATPMEYYMPKILNQGGTPHCVGFGGAGLSEAASTSGSVDLEVDNDLGHAIYYDCKVKDGQPGWENGSSVHTLAKVLRDRGIILAYSFAQVYQEVLEWVHGYGPVVWGTDWTQDMFTPDPSTGLIHVTGLLKGGHCYVQLGTGKKLGELYANSWGETWPGSVKGKFYMSQFDATKLFMQNGEALLCVKAAKPGILPRPWEEWIV
jgi:hypothetical protein